MVSVNDPFMFIMPSIRGRILVVDDQRMMRGITALLLRAEGYDVIEAGSGEEALAILAEIQVDLMLTDLKMEPMDGLTLLQRALKMEPRLQVIIMTAFGSSEISEESLRLGACDYIQKPMKHGEMEHRVGRAVERSRLLSPR
ncbi:Response regulator of zinc sigma-54-dependent two-component system [Cystobacter fuscus DSM 2262]|uniref:Response regulator of zinc sigma-54-dependent two-component system n=1 Tax=Cystobacter fuscus (strain ATCC 25194 / DSM 2262 / NBRC 100088 / M29) TaxID=1242864 RepID=S9R0A2_CYSF2|nr:Response regulator of zinc sigma-54-dependent two-component system [Cystobacter fuscus DSM 2262]